MPTEAYVHEFRAGAAGAPLLVLLHGTGGDERQLLALGRQVAPGASLLSPRGDVSEHGAARFFRRTGEGVFDMDDLARATAKMAAFVEAHMATAEPAGVLGLGYSNGANILATTLFSRPPLFEAVALMHPLIPFEPAVAGDLTSRRVLITAGRRDPICPPDLTLRLERSLRDHGAEVAMVWHDGGHELRPSEIQAAQEFLTGE